MVAVFETSSADLLRVGTVGPDLLALVAILWVLRCGGPRGFLVAGAVGLLGDLLLPGRLGLGMALLLLIGYAITRLRARLLLEHPVWQLATIWLGTTLFAFGLALWSWASGEAAVSIARLALRSAGVGLYTAAVAVPVLLVIGWIGQPLDVRRNALLDFKP